MTNARILTSCILVFLLAIGAPLAGQSTTAKQPLAVVVSTARTQASDAELVYVGMPASIETNGMSPHWIYVFKSTAQGRLLEVSYQGGTATVSTVLSIEDDFVNLSLVALPDNWYDSDLVVASSHEAGGSSFLNQHPEKFISARLYAGGQPVPGRQDGYYVAPFWVIDYENPNGAFSNTVDAASGSVRGAYSIAWFLENVEQAAENLAADAELVRIAGDELRPNGRSQNWRLAFKSESVDEVYELSLREYRLTIQDELTVGDKNSLMRSPPLPPGWIVPEAAVAAANRNGGNVFWQSNQAVRLSAGLSVSEVFLQQGDFHLPIRALPVWKIYYESAGTPAGKPVTASPPLAAIDNLIARVGENGILRDRQLTSDASSANVIAGSLVIPIDAMTGVATENLLDTLTPFTARERIATADSTAQVWALDAQLVYLDAAVVDTTGESLNWTYVYQSTEKGSQRRYSVLGRATGSIVQMSGTEGLLVHPGMSPLPAHWINSDSAYAVAEREVGQVFRREFGGRYSDVNLTTFQQEVPVERPSWRVFYESPTGTANAVIDALYGFSYDNPPQRTARTHVADIQTLALGDDPSHQLVKISAGRVSNEGTKSRWRYFFKSSRGDTLAEYRIHGDVVYRNFTDSPEIRPDLHVLPDDWIDSDSALAQAEQLGGSAFRAQHEDATILMILQAAEDVDAETSEVPAMWIVTYRAAGFEETVLIAAQIPTDAEQSHPIPSSLAILSQNYPNPFSGTTRIGFNLPVASHVVIDVYDTTGRLVDTLVDGIRSAGKHESSWRPESLGAGIYLCRLMADIAGNPSQTVKMLLIR